MKRKSEENVTIDSSFDIPMKEVPNTAKKTVADVESRQEVKQDSSDSKETLICPLKNKRVIVRFVPRPSAMIQNPRHILYGGMAETATRTFVVPKLSTGLFKNVLTDSEKTYLERVMGLEYNALSIYKKVDNFWDDSNDNGIGRVVLHKQDNYLDLSVPEDYIKYKILLANKDQIASSLQELEDRPKATYQFVIIDEDAEAKMATSNMSVVMQCYMEYGKISEDKDTLRVLLELLDGRPISSKVQLDFLQGKINEHIQAKPKLFLAAIRDELLPTKVLIKKSIEAGLIGKKNDLYFLRSDNSPLCEIDEESTLNNAARYLNNPKRQELLFHLEAKTKDIQ